MGTHINLRQLRAFTEVYRLRNLTHAADALHITQSSMSVLIRQLEDSFGVQLFERSPRGLRPTVAAEEALPMAQRILSDVTQLQRNMATQASTARAVLAFTCTPALASTVVPGVLAAFKASMPGTRIIIHDSAGAALIDEVLSQEVEFSIGYFDAEPEALMLSKLAAGFLSLVCRRDSPLATLHRVSWAHLAGQTIINLKRGLTLQQQIGQTLLSLGRPYEPEYEVTYLHTALAMVQQGLGVAVLPDYLILANPHSDNLVACKLHDPVVERSLRVHTRKGHRQSDPAQLFLSMLRERLSRQPEGAEGGNLLPE